LNASIYLEKNLKKSISDLSAICTATYRERETFFFLRAATQRVARRTAQAGFRFYPKADIRLKCNIYRDVKTPFFKFLAPE
jgi:hypothetical protein